MRAWRLGLAGALALGLAVLAPLGSTGGAPAKAAERRRVALVIGNQAYKQVRPLYAPVDDARAWGAALQEAGFQVDPCYDCSAEQMRAKIDAFNKRIAAGDEAFFFYAGHGAEQEHRNYLFPVDALVSDCGDLEKWGINLNSVLGAMREASVRIAVLDACRDAPFPSCQYAAVGGDLFTEQPVPTGTLVAYATRSGYRAEDAVGRLSPYTTHLLPLVRAPGLPLVEALSLAKPEVQADTDGRQQPFESNSLGGAPWVLRPGPHPQAVKALQDADEARRRAADARWREVAILSDDIRKYDAVLDFLVAHGGSGASSALVARDWLNTHAYLGVPSYGVVRPGNTSVTIAILSSSVPLGKRSDPPIGGPTGRSYLALKGTAAEMNFVELSAGAFTMGSKRKEGEHDERPQRRVRLLGFAIGRSEVTQAQWSAVVQAAQQTGDPDAAGLKADPASFKGAQRPVEQVNWCEVVRFANALSRLEHLSPAYTVGSDCEQGNAVAWDRSANGYRLPTEVEWEYAARAGTTSTWPIEEKSEQLCATANFLDQSGKTEHPMYSWADERCDDGYADTSPVCSLKSNPWGLCDMLGNVYEWVWDWYRNAYDAAEINNPTGPTRGDNRVLRGGSWYVASTFVRPGDRLFGRPSNADNNVGFRLVLPVAAPEP